MRRLEKMFLSLLGGAVLGLPGCYDSGDRRPEDPPPDVSEDTPGDAAPDVDEEEPPDVDMYGPPVDLMYGPPNP
jgi:hypothetical protein